MHALTYLIPLLSLAAQAFADEGYADTCNSIGVFQPNYGQGSPNHVALDANCQTAPGKIYNVDTTININACFTNQNGVLQGSASGGFGGSCKNLSIKGTILSAQCKNYGGNYVGTSIDTYYYISNNGGRMQCFGRFPAP